LPIVTSGAELLAGLPEPIRLTTLRVAQEALTNAAKHATGATLATVTLTRDGKVLTMTLHDNGEGFDTSESGSGIGLSSMRERAEGLGGELLIESTPSLGTTITLRLPLR
jgi:signal transduction histidine kinase